MACVRIRIHTRTATKRGITRIIARFTAATRFTTCRGTISRRSTRRTAAPGIVRAGIIFIVLTFVAAIKAFHTGSIIQHIRRCTCGRLTGPTRT